MKLSANNEKLGTGPTSIEAAARPPGCTTPSSQTARAAATWGCCCRCVSGVGLRVELRSHNTALTTAHSHQRRRATRFCESKPCARGSHKLGLLRSGSLQCRVPESALLMEPIVTPVFGWQADRRRHHRPGRRRRRRRRRRRCRCRRPGRRRRRRHAVSPYTHPDPPYYDRTRCRARKRGKAGGCEVGEKPASIVSSRYPVTTAASKNSDLRQILAPAHTAHRH